jgi:hypothetical protein
VSTAAMRITRWVGRIEGRLDEDALYLVECRCELGGEARGLGGEREFAVGAHQQRIADDIAQAAERTAHRGLRKANVGGRTRDVAVAQERFERRQ